MLLAALYAPQNVFCYVIDSKSSAKFKSQMNALASCFDNVHITTSQFLITSAGRNMTRAQLACLELLVKDVQQQWKYAVVLQVGIIIIIIIIYIHTRRNKTEYGGICTYITWYVLHNRRGSWDCRIFKGCVGLLRLGGGRFLPLFYYSINTRSIFSLEYIFFCLVKLVFVSLCI